ncbi:MAG: hypothetical protein EBX37_01235 [Alphaproteobacteria bacterium]|nr:hypothetical protein [Alphaproteobacteria bacterium]
MAEATQPDPNEAFYAERLEKLLRGDDFRAKGRGAIAGRMRELGISRPIMIANIIGNTANGVEYPVERFLRGQGPEEEMAGRLRELHTTARSDSRQHLKRQDDRFPPELIEYYIETDGKKDVAPLQTPGGMLSRLDIEHALTAEARRVAVEAIAEAMGVSLATRSAGVAPRL